jgi:proteic killer suppression protein
MVDLGYASHQMERLCTDLREMNKSLSATVVKSLKRRIAELRMAEVIEDVLLGPGRWERLAGDRAGLWSGHLSANWRVIVAAEPEATSALVVGVEDYHGR